MPELLVPREIRRQLAEIPDYGTLLQNPVRIDCVRVGRNIRMDRIVDNEIRTVVERNGPLLGLARDVHTSLLMGSGRRLVMLCDLFAENNEPGLDVVWTPEDRKAGAILGVMSCLMVLIRCSRLRDMLFGYPGRLVVGVIDDGRIILQQGEGVKMLRSLREQM